MKRHRFIGPYDLRSAEIVLEDDAARQMALVLKMRHGEIVLLCDGKGREAAFEILEFKKTSVRLKRIGDASDVDTEPMKQVTLYASILKRENFELIVQKATECGVLRIVPVISQRTIKKDVKLERLREIAREAAELSGRGVVPEVSEPVKFEQALEQAEGQKYFFDAEGKSFLPTGERISLFVGPEGGWTEEEHDLAMKSGCSIAGLGPRMLRGETAAIVATFVTLFP